MFTWTWKVLTLEPALSWFLFIQVWNQVNFSKIQFLRLSVFFDSFRESTEGNSEFAALNSQKPF